MQHLETRAFAQAQVEQHHLGLPLLGFNNGLRGITAFADHLMACGFEQGVQAVSQDELVIDEVHPRHAAVSVAGRPKLPAHGVVDIKLPD